MVKKIFFVEIVNFLQWGNRFKRSWAAKTILICLSVTRRPFSFFVTNQTETNFGSWAINLNGYDKKYIYIVNYSILKYETTI